MKISEKITYYVRIVFYIIGLILTFLLVQNIKQVGLFAYIFLVLYLMFSFEIIKEIISRKMIYKKDVIYNSMQIGFNFYLGVITFKTYYDKIVVMDNTIKYFNLNYIILSILIVIIVAYKMWDVKTQKNVR